MDIDKNLANLRKNIILPKNKWQKMQMSKNSYAKLERGESKLIINYLFKIAQYF